MPYSDRGGLASAASATIAPPALGGLEPTVAAFAGVTAV